MHLSGPGLRTVREVLSWAQHLRSAKKLSGQDKYFN